MFSSKSDDYEKPTFDFTLRILFYGLAYAFANNVFATLATNDIQLLWPANSANVLSRLNGFNAFSSIAVIFIMSWNDKLHIKRGRRIAFMFIGAAVSALGFSLLSITDSKILFIICFYVINTGGAVAFACTTAIPIEHFPENKQGLSGSVVTILSVFGSLCAFGMVATLLDSWGTNKFYAIFAFVTALCVLVPIATVTEPTPQPQKTDKKFITPKDNPDFYWVLLGRSLASLSMGIQLFMIMLFRDQLYGDLSYDSAVTASTVLFAYCGVAGLLAAVITASILSAFADKLPVRLLPILGVLIQAVALVLFVILPFTHYIAVPIAVIYSLGGVVTGCGEHRLIGTVVSDQGENVAQAVSMYQGFTQICLFAGSFIYGPMLSLFVASTGVDTEGNAYERYSGAGYTFILFVAAILAVSGAAVWSFIRPADVKLVIESQDQKTTSNPLAQARAQA